LKIEENPKCTKFPFLSHCYISSRRLVVKSSFNVDGIIHTLIESFYATVKTIDLLSVSVLTYDAWRNYFLCFIIFKNCKQFQFNLKIMTKLFSKTIAMDNEGSLYCPRTFVLQMEWKWKGKVRKKLAKIRHATMNVISRGL